MTRNNCWQALLCASFENLSEISTALDYREAWEVLEINTQGVFALILHHSNKIGNVSSGITLFQCKVTTIGDILTTVMHLYIHQMALL